MSSCSSVLVKDPEIENPLTGVCTPDAGTARLLELHPEYAPYHAHFPDLTAAFSAVCRGSDVLANLADLSPFPKDEVLSLYQGLEQMHALLRLRLKIGVYHQQSPEENLVAGEILRREEQNLKSEGQRLKRRGLADDCELHQQASRSVDTGRKMRNQPEDLRKLMATFLQANGGTVRFDVYMNEHLTNRSLGFYEHVRINKDGDFTTDGSVPEFPWLIYLYARQRGLHEQDFMETGGGNGDFKRGFKRACTEARYISVELSEHLAAVQACSGGLTACGSAVSLPVRSGSIEGIIFSNELIDAVPARIFRIRKTRSGPILGEEAYVRLQDGQEQPVFEFGLPSRDDFTEMYECFLRERRSDIEDGAVLSVAPGTEAALKEMLRVLHRGRIILFDYGFHDDSGGRFGRKHEEQVFYTEKGSYHGPVDILAHPYTVDITYKVDFEFLKWVAERSGAEVSFHWRSEFLGRLMIDHGWIKNGIPDPSRFSDEASSLISHRDLVVMEVVKA